MSADLIRETAFVSAALHARAVQWDGSHKMAQVIVDELNLLALEFDFRLASAREHREGTTRTMLSPEPTLTLEVEYNDGDGQQVELTPGVWLGLFIRHGALVVALPVDDRVGEIMFGERHPTLTIPGT